MEVDVDLGAHRCVVMSRMLAKQCIENPVLQNDIYVLLTFCLYVFFSCVFVPLSIYNKK